VWAHDVLDEYFNVVASEPLVDQAKAKFRCLPLLGTTERCVPYQRDLTQPPPVHYDALAKLSKRRKSVRWYLPQPVPRDLLDQAIAIAALAPSACNRQPFEFRIFDDPEMVQQIAALPGGTQGFYQNFPVVVVVVGKLGAYFDEQDRHLIYTDSSLAVMAFMYALETLGLSSCAINWHDSGPKVKDITRLLKLEPDERVTMVISVGYPDPEGLVAHSQKKDLDSLRRYN
jgi:nitroreductase